MGKEGLVGGPCYIFISAKTLRHSGFPGDHSTQYWWSSITFKFPVLMRGAAFVMI